MGAPETPGPAAIRDCDDTELIGLACLRSVEEKVERKPLDKMYGEFSSHLDGFEKYVMDSTHLDAAQTPEAVCKKMEAGESQVL